MEERSKLAQSLTKARQNLLREKDHEQDDEEKIHIKATEQSSITEESIEQEVLSEHAAHSPSTSSQSSSLSAESVSSEDEEESNALHANAIQKPSYKPQRKRRKLQPVEYDFNLQWDASLENVSIEESVEWMPNCADQSELTLETLVTWMRTCSRQKTITEALHSTRFCTADVHERMSARKKQLFDEHSIGALRQARARANPYELLGMGPYQNRCEGCKVNSTIINCRAAMKMANIDAVFDGIISRADVAGGDLNSAIPLACESTTDSASQLYHFADICAGPGGFSEYLLLRRLYSARGYGITLKGKDDFAWDNFGAAPAELLNAHYGVTEDGDITVAENIRSFVEYVLRQSDDGVHVAMADGGFSVQGHEELQELASKQLYLCQALIALSILRTGGVYVCKLFDTLTTFSAGLVYILRKCFDKVAIHKPNTSRPANAERYIVCVGLRSAKKAREVLVPYLHCVNERLNELRDEWPSLSDAAVVEREGGDHYESNALDVCNIVSDAVLDADLEFIEYLTNTNNKLAHRQYVYLCKCDAYARNPRLGDGADQTRLRDECLKYWRLDINATTDRRRNDVRIAPQSTFAKLTGLHEVPHELLNEKLLTNSKDAKTAAYFFTTSTQCTLLLSMGNGVAFLCSSDAATVWRRAEFSVRLPKDTIVMVDLCTVYRKTDKDNKPQQYHMARIVDAITLCGNSVYGLPFEQRQAHIRRLCTALKAENAGGVQCITVSIHSISMLTEANLKERLVPNPPRSNKLAFRLCENGDDYFYAHGLILLSNVESALRSTRQLWLWRDADALECGAVTLTEICEVINRNQT